MSNLSGKSLVPPFLAQGGKKGKAPKVVPKKTPSSVVKSTAPPPPKVVCDPPVQPSLAGDQPRDSPDKSPLKRARKDGQKDGPSGVVTATASQHLFASLGTKYSDEAETSNWWKATPEENANALTKCLAEAFIRQAAHTKNFFLLDKKNKVLEFQKVEDKRSLEETYKKQLSYETGQIRTDLKNARREKNDLEKSFKELQKISEEAAKKKDEEIVKLTRDLDATKALLANAESTFLAQGQVTFMKGFIRAIPDFDWDQLGEGNADFAETLKLQIAEEDAKEAEEEARLAEEARIANEATNANQIENAP